MNVRVAPILAALTAVFCTFAAPSDAHADWLAVWARGHGSYLQGDDAKLPYFANNDAGLGYGFAVGAEVLQFDLFLDANFHPQGSQWNQLGLGWDMDLVPGPLLAGPAAQLVYFFGKQHDGSDGVKGLWPRAGVQAGVEFAKFFLIGIEGYVGYIVSIPDPAAGVAYIAASHLTIKFDIL